MSEFMDETLLTSSGFQQQLDGRNMVSGADNNAEGTPLLVFEVDSAAATTTNVTLTNGVRVIDARGAKNGAGGGGETVQVLNAGNAITNAHDANVADNAAVRLTGGTDTVDDAQHEIAGGGTLRVTTVGAGTSAVDIFVLGVRT